jgi:hypothetical protein
MAIEFQYITFSRRRTVHVAYAKNIYTLCGQSIAVEDSISKALPQKTKCCKVCSVSMKKLQEPQQ